MMARVSLALWFPLALTLSPQPVPTVTLSNGVEMPAVLFGTGTDTWLNDSSTAEAVLNGLLAGFTGIDCANHYRNQRGVATGLRQARQQGIQAPVFLATKACPTAHPQKSMNGK